MKTMSTVIPCLPSYRLLQRVSVWYAGDATVHQVYSIYHLTSNLSDLGYYYSWPYHQIRTQTSSTVEERLALLRTRQVSESNLSPNRLSLLGLPGFLQSLQQNSSKILKMGHDSFVPNSPHFFIWNYAVVWYYVAFIGGTTSVNLSPKISEFSKSTSTIVIILCIMFKIGRSRTTMVRGK